MSGDPADPEDKLDETIDETFPASDPPGNTVETGIRVGIDAAAGGHLTVRDNPEARRFEIAVGEQVAFLQYRRKENGIVLIHTEVPTSLRGRGLAKALANFALDAARAERLHVTVLCPFVQAYLKRHPEIEAPRQT